MNLPSIPFPKPPRAVVVTFLVVLGIAMIIVGTSGIVRIAYAERILPNVTVGGVSVGGLTQGEAIAALQHAYDAMIEHPLRLAVDETTHTVTLRQTSEETAYALVDFDPAAAVTQAYAVGRTNTAAKQFLPLLQLVGIRHVAQPAHMVIAEEQLTEQIRTLFPDVEVPATPTDYDIVKNTGDEGGYHITVTPPVNGTGIDFTTLFATLKTDAEEDFALETQEIPTTTIASNVSITEAETLTAAVEQALANAPYTLSYTKENRTEPTTWTITADDLMSWLIPGREVREDEPENANGTLVLTLDETAMTDFFDDLHTEIDVAAQNARFAMEGDRVVEFAASHDGVTVNNADTIRAVGDFLGTKDAEILVMVDRVAPTIPTESVNSLGIKEVLGVGTSDFKNSPANRIANIKHGAEKLNGLLIAPGETLSLLDHLRPFTVEDGYLPELVIKGDEIKPEVGGGLCQIGTTTFRAVMNSGLHVVERRNHSLVVSYYNDPGNNNPGTDATIYDPSPDFKFENDMSTYILLTTEVDETNKKLYFTFWGTADGRKGSYEPPTVLSWTGYGDAQYKETETLAPGVEKCQAAHPGATTTFTYNVTYADGTAHEEEFLSSYRSLPKICLVGKAADAVPETPAIDTSTGDEPASSTDTVTDNAIPLE